MGTQPNANTCCRTALRSWREVYFATLEPGARQSIGLSHYQRGDRRQLQRQTGVLDVVKRQRSSVSRQTNVVAQSTICRDAFLMSTPFEVLEPLVLWGAYTAASGTS